jgi:hypothetical protein
MFDRIANAQTQTLIDDLTSTYSDLRDANKSHDSTGIFMASVTLAIISEELEDLGLEPSILDHLHDSARIEVLSANQN